MDSAPSLVGSSLKKRCWPVEAVYLQVGISVNMIEAKLFSFTS